MELERFRLESGQSQLESGQFQLESGQSQSESGQSQLESGRFRQESGQFQLESGRFQLTLPRFQLESGRCKRVFWLPLRAFSRSKAVPQRMTQRSAWQDLKTGQSSKRSDNPICCRSQLGFFITKKPCQRAGRALKAYIRFFSRLYLRSLRRASADLRRFLMLGFS